MTEERSLSILEIYLRLKSNEDIGSQQALLLCQEYADEVTRLRKALSDIVNYNTQICKTSGALFFECPNQDRHLKPGEIDTYDNRMKCDTYEVDDKEHAAKALLQGMKP